MDHHIRQDIIHLVDIPNIGKAMARDLYLVGIHRPQQLIGRDPLALYDKLCAVTGQSQDPCVLDVFMAAVNFMEGGDARPWWTFTDERKQLLTKTQQM